MTLRSLDNIRWTLAALLLTLSVAMLVGLTTASGIDARHAMVALGTLALAGMMAPFDTYIIRRGEERARKQLEQLARPKSRAAPEA